MIIPTIIMIMIIIIITISKYNNVFFTTSVSVRKGRGQHAVIKLRVLMMMMTNGPIRVKQAKQSSAVIGQYV